MATSHLTPDDLLRATLAAVAPGGQLREGLDRILRGRTGALIVLGFDRTVESICSGGFWSPRSQRGCSPTAGAWGRHWARTRPNPGNHDWGEQNGTPYFEYFGASAGPRTGYHSFTMGAWHVLSLNSNVAAGVSSPQFQWAARCWSAPPA